MDFGLSAEWFLSQLAANKGIQTFVIEACSANAFVIMAETGFFALTGDHYQMTLPSNLDMGRVSRRILSLRRRKMRTACVILSCCWLLCRIHKRQNISVCCAPRSADYSSAGTSIP
jgi:hypothetical protein